MQFWIIQTLNSLALGGLLFLLAAGFSLIFGLMRIANLTHGSLFMLGAYLGVTVLRIIPNLWVAALIGGLAVAVFGGLLERFILRRLAGNALGQVLVTLGVSFIVALFVIRAMLAIVTRRGFAPFGWIRIAVGGAVFAALFAHLL